MKTQRYYNLSGDLSWVQRFLSVSSPLFGGQKLYLLTRVSSWEKVECMVKINSWTCYRPGLDGSCPHLPQTVLITRGVPQVGFQPAFKAGSWNPGRLSPPPTGGIILPGGGRAVDILFLFQSGPAVLLLKVCGIPGRL